MNTIERIKNYFKNEGLSQSELKGLIYGLHRHKIEKEKPLYFEEKSSMLMGTIVGDMLSHNIEEFYEKYHIGEIDKPTDTVASIIRLAYDSMYKEPKSFDTKENALIYAANYHGYGKGKYSDETILNKLNESNYYWEYLIELGDKTLISNKEYDLAKKIVSSLKSHEYSKWLFEQKGIYETDLYFTWEDVSCKGLIDYMTVIDNVLYIVDFKIPEYNTQFEQSAERFSYPIQAVFYTEAVKNNIDYVKSLLGDFDSIAPFHFLTESQKSCGTPLIYILSNNKREKALNEILDGLDKYKWHKTFNIWDVDRDIYLNKGKIIL